MPRRASGGDRGDLEVESLLRIVLVLAVIWLVLEVVGGVLGILGELLGPLRPLLGLLVVVLLVLWLTDRL
ncbi:DUF7554 family protein [Halobellus ruber]|uniref:Uncharacterized protein n=1 Tax=Halobellus ruber TaxID=2761102 RepID=A0A7J9SMU9_9EURY|nr:hypothetical protein [Halobellus ruber]MBB6647377.1 hypothetical protein [Halobellus ruber]